MRPSSNSRAPTAAANLGREHQTALGSGGRHPGSTAENAAAGRGNPGGNSQGVCGRCPQRSLAAAAAHRPAQALAASPRHGRANSAEGTQGAPRKMRRQGAATPGPTHRVSVGCAPSLRLPRQSHTAPLRRFPPAPLPSALRPRSENDT